MNMLGRPWAAAIGGGAVAGVVVTATYLKHPGGWVLAFGAAVLAVLAVLERDRSLNALVVGGAALVVTCLIITTALITDQPRIATRVALAALAGATLRVVVNATVDSILAGLACGVLGWIGWIAVLCGLAPGVLVGLSVREQALRSDRTIDRRAGPANAILAGFTTLAIAIVGLLGR